MWRRLLLWLGVVVVVGLGVAFALPATRYRLLALVRNERLYNGRPLSYWTGALREDDDPDVRRQAAETLGDAQLCKDAPANDPECRAVVAALVGALGDPEGRVRKMAASALLTYPRESPVPTDSATVARLTGALADGEVLVRKAAARSLWQAGSAARGGDGVARLTKALEDKDDFVREYAARTLGRIGPEAAPAVPELLERLRKDEERDVREHAAKSLGLIGPEAVGKRLPETVAALTKALTDEAADVRENSAIALGQLGGATAIPALRKLAADPEPRVRAAAAGALKRLEPPGAGKSK